MAEESTKLARCLPLEDHSAQAAQSTEGRRDELSTKRKESALGD